MKQLPKQDQPDVSGGRATTEYPQGPCLPTIWPPEDGPTFPDVPEPGCETPPTI